MDQGQISIIHRIKYIYIIKDTKILKHIKILKICSLHILRIAVADLKPDTSNVFKL